MAALTSLIANPYSYNKNTGKITILSTPGDDVETVDNIGTGTGILVDNTDVHNPKIRTLINGTDITINTIGNEVEINYTGLPPGAVNSVVNDAGSGYNLVENPGSNPSITVKNIKAGTDIAIVDDGNSLEISSTGVAAVTLNNLIPVPSPGSENVLTNPGTASSFDFRAITEGAGIQITSDADDVLVQQRGMQISTLGGVYGNQNDDSIVIGYNNRAIIGTNQNCNVIGSNLPALTAQDSNMIISYNNLTASAGSTYTNCNIMLSAQSSELLGASNSTVIADLLNAPATSLNNCIYIGDMNNTTASDKSICINSNLYVGNVVMADESVYFGTGQNAVTLVSGQCCFDFRAPTWFYKDLGTGTSDSILHYNSSTGQISHGAVSSGTTSQMLYYDSGSKVITYGNLPASSVTMANPGAGVAIDVLMNPGTGNSFQFKSILASGGMDINTSGGNKVSMATMNVNYSTSVTPTSNTVLANNSTTTLTGWAVGVLQNMYNVGGLFNVVTGVYTTAPLANPFRIAYNLTFAYSDSNAAVTPVVITVQLYNQTDAIVQRQMKFRIDHTDTVSYTFSGITNLNNASKQYVFRIINPSLAGTQTVYNSSEFTNLVIDRLL